MAKHSGAQHVRRRGLVPTGRAQVRWCGRRISVWVWSAVLSTAALAGCAGDVREPPAAVADRAMDRFRDAWRTGEWQPFLDMTTAEFSFWFPVGPYAGKHEGTTGHERLIDWANDNGLSGARLNSVVTARTTAGSRVIYETEAVGTAGPALTYRNWEIVVLTVSDDRLSGLHEYWGAIPPQ
ncbi:nuclear transport factor 2 family protein [Mycolicibacterium wolinskyi]|uniref:nuclear transport factor 2 family protein n=1 Tax=Mycolicibacterium wolinskyi TaxID=59750 RepID=UPI003917AD21